MATDEYWEATRRGDLAWRIAQAVKEALGSYRSAPETKEIRNTVEGALRREVSLDRERGRVRLVTAWMHIPEEGHGVIDQEEGER